MKTIKGKNIRYWKMWTIKGITFISYKLTYHF